MGTRAKEVGVPLPATMSVTEELDSCLVLTRFSMSVSKHDPRKASITLESEIGVTDDLER